MSLVELLGESLQSKDGTVPTEQVVKTAKAVAIYFSAHWCPPCRGFTPKLAEWYLKDLKQKGLEVVFVSSDRDESAFSEYFAEMPWLTVPYADRERKEKLSSRFKVRGIPSLVVVSPEGTTITTDGRAAVSNDPTGEDLPWKPNSFSELLGDSFLRGKETVGREAVAGKPLMLYFSAHWCPPCRGFTPKLVESYNKMRANGVEFELVFASSDQDQAAFDDYFGGMPWLALPFGDKRKEQWSSVFKVSGIPSLVVLDKDLEVVTMNGRSAVTKDPEGREFPWHPKPISDASDPDGIDDQPSVVVFMETNDSETQKQVVSELEPVAIKYKELAKKSGDDLKYMFFGAFNLDGPIPRIRSMCSQPALPPRPHEHPLEKSDSQASWVCDGCSKGGEECKERYRCTKGCDYDYCGECQAKTSEKVQPVAPVAVLLDLRKGGYYPLEGEVTKSSVEKLLADYEAGTLEKKSFQG